ncbi:MAG: lipoprotein [Gammaproteobacteria bacterium]
MNKMKKLLLIAAAGCLLAACGQSGALYLPGDATAQAAPTTPQRH